MRKQAYQFACGSEDYHDYDFEGKGVEGGVVIFHPFHILPEAKERLWNEIESEDIDFRLWKKFSGEDWSESESNNCEFKLWKKLMEKEWSEILSSVYYAPHFHILGVGEKGDKSFEEAKESDRFVWKGIGGLSDSDDLGKCIMYLLSHTGVFEKSHYSSIVWFGSLSSSKWSLDRAQTRLRNGSTVKEFTLDLVEDFVSRTHEELDGSLVCDNCGSGLLHISSAPDCWSKKDLEFEAELKVAYDWWRGSIPPPENLESESDCWDYLEKLVLDELEVAEYISKMVRGSSCLSVVGEVEKLG